MNILMVDYEYPPLGGGGGVIHRLVSEELARRHHVTMVTSGFKDLPARETRGGVDIVRVPVLLRTELPVASWPSMLSFPLAVAHRARHVLTERDFDIANAHFAVPSGPASVWLARRAGIPHVITIHGGDIFDPSKRASPHKFPPLHWAVARVMQASARIVASSNNTLDNVRSYWPALRSREVDMIPLGIRDVPSRPATRTSLGLPEDVFLGVVVGRLIPRKANDLLLRALAHPGLESVHVALVGAGPEQASLESLSRELGIGDRVHFMGWVEDEVKWQALRAADAFLSATSHEGFGLMFLEAMAAGLPIVCPDHGGHTDFLTDGETGFVAPVGDERLLAEAIARLVADPDLAARIGVSNRETFDQRYHIRHCAKAYEDLFEETLSAARGATPG